MGTDGRKDNKIIMSLNQSAWKPIDVSLSEPESSVNHYDNISSSRKANKDLEGQPSESVGIFVGLEVLDGSLYEVRNSRIIIKSTKTKHKSDGEKERLVSSTNGKKPKKRNS